MIDNQDSSPEMIELRHRAKGNQSTINIESALSNKQVSSSSSSSSVGGAGTSGTVLGGLVGGEIPPTYCFTGDTLFTLATDEKIPFKELYEKREQYIGRFARSFDRDGVQVQGKILDVLKTTASEFCQVTFLDGSIDEVKPNHRYLSDSLDYVEIRQLFGKCVVSETGRRLRVIAIKMRNASEGIEMFNASIETYHNYVANGKRVHNAKRRDEDFS